MHSICIVLYNHHTKKSVVNKHAKTTSRQLTNQTHTQRNSTTHTESHIVKPNTQIGEGNGNPLQCSCLENPRDRGAWWAAVYGVAQSWTRLKRLSSSSSNTQITYTHPHKHTPMQCRRIPALHGLLSAHYRTFYDSGNILHLLCPIQ